MYYSLPLSHKHCIRNATELQQSQVTEHTKHCKNGTHCLPVCHSVFRFGLGGLDYQMFTERGAAAHCSPKGSVKLSCFVREFEKLIYCSVTKDPNIAPHASQRLASLNSVVDIFF